MIAIYGASERTAEVLARLSVTPERVFSTAGGGEFAGRMIEPATSLDETITRLIVTTSYYPQVVLLLEELGFPLERVEIAYHDGLDNIYFVDPVSVIERREAFRERDRVYAELQRRYPGRENPLVVDRDQFRVESIKTPLVTGANLEFGTYRGESIRTFAPHVEAIFGFDTFSGLPADWTISRPRGSIDAGGLPEVPPNVFLESGTFEETVPTWLAKHPDPVRFVFIDCDLYESTIFVLKSLDNRLRDGSVILFDELLPIPEDDTIGEFRAWSEYLGQTTWHFDFDARCGTAVRFICRKNNVE